MSYWRVHRNELPDFDAENAYSASWGSTFIALDLVECDFCATCDAAAGLIDANCAENIEDIEDCDDQDCDDDCARCHDRHCPECERRSSHGTVPADRGYSCCESYDDLRDYYAQRGTPDEEGIFVVEFEGDEVGTGPDDEPLVVPTKIVNIYAIGEVFR